MVNRPSPTIFVGLSPDAWAQQFAALLNEHERPALRTPFFLIDSYVDLSNIRPRGERLNNGTVDRIITDELANFWGETRCPDLVPFVKPKPDWKGLLPHERSGQHRSIERIEAQGLPPRHPTKGFRRTHKRFRKTNRV